MGFLRSYAAFYFAIVAALRTQRVQALLTACLLIALAQSFVFMWLEDWRFIDAFYFSAVSMSTVGYGDFTPETSLGKLAAVGFLMIGIGIFVLTVSSIAETILRELRQSEKFGIGSAISRPKDE